MFSKQGVDASRESFSHQPLEQSHEFDFEIMVEVFAVSKRQHIVVRISLQISSSAVAMTNAAQAN